MFKLARWTERSTVRAVHEDDLRSYLEGLGVLGQIESGAARCHSCGSTITLDNLGALYPIGSATGFLCDRLPCLSLQLDRDPGGDDEA